MQKRVLQRLAKDNLHAVLLSSAEEQDFYGKVCNDTLWPLFHYFPDRLRITPEAWQRYVEVNERFADTIVAHCEPDSRVWVHDFHLMLVPAMLRARAPRPRLDAPPRRGSVVPRDRRRARPSPAAGT